MIHSNDAETQETLAKLAQSRAEILNIFEPPPETGEPGDAQADGRIGGFPRSRTMKLLMSGRGIGTVSAVLGGLVIARPALAFRLLRMLPAGAVARLLLVKAIASLKIGSKNRAASRRRESAPDSAGAAPAGDGINPS